MLLLIPVDSALHIQHDSDALASRVCVYVHGGAWVAYVCTVRIQYAYMSLLHMHMIQSLL
jgi:acetyl esterase/lipase